MNTKEPETLSEAEQISLSIQEVINEALKKLDGSEKAEYRRKAGKVVEHARVRLEEIENEILEKRLEEAIKRSDHSLYFKIASFWAQLRPDDPSLGDMHSRNLKLILGKIDLDIGRVATLQDLYDAYKTGRAQEWIKNERTIRLLEEFFKNKGMDIG